MNGLREFFNTTAGKVTGIVVGLAALAFCFFMFKGYFGQNEAARMASDRMFVDSATGKPFEHTLKAGDKIPLAAPSGGNTGYPAELCYWTTDGKIKDDPTAVLVNGWVGKPGPTFCPDCGRLVVMHNPPRVAGKPPATKAEYEKQQAGRRPDDQGDGR